MPHPPTALAQEEIRKELFSDHRDVHSEFVKNFPGELERLVLCIHNAHTRIVEFGKNVERSRRAAWTEAFLLSALNNILTSSKLLVSGLLQPSGNQMRAYGESYAMALLVSHRETRVFEKVERDDKFPVHKAIQMVKRKKNLRRLKVDAEAWAQFERITDWYDGYSHPSLFALASTAKFDEPGCVILGSGFDEKKINAYRKELIRRISAAERLVDLAIAVEAQLKERP